MNILRGSVETVASGVATLRTPRGTMAASTGCVAAQPRMETCFFVNADQIALGPQSQGENQVSAKLLSYKFVGSMVTLYLELPDGGEMKVSVPEPVYDRVGVKIGDMVHASWPARAAQLFQVTE